MESFEWINSQDLESLVTPFPHHTRDKLLNELDCHIEGMLLDGASDRFDAGAEELSPIASVVEAKTEFLEDVTKRDLKEARYLAKRTFRSFGYSSRDEMIANEPGFDMLKFFDEADESEFCEAWEYHRDLLYEICYDKLASFARAILDLQHHGVKDKAVTFTFQRLDKVYSKAVPRLVESNNRDSAPMLPKLKIETQTSTGRIVLSVVA